MFAPTQVQGDGHPLGSSLWSARKAQAKAASNGSGCWRTGGAFSSRFAYVSTNDGVLGIRATAAGPAADRTALYQCSVSPARLPRQLSKRNVIVLPLYTLK